MIGMTSDDQLTDEEILALYGPVSYPGRPQTTAEFQYGSPEQQRSAARVIAKQLATNFPTRPLVPQFSMAPGSRN